MQENLAKFEKMRTAQYEEGEAFLRMKGDLMSDNPAMWDTVRPHTRADRQRHRYTDAETQIHRRRHMDTDTQTARCRHADTRRCEHVQAPNNVRVRMLSPDRADSASARC
eukprot:2210905-Rhodomonas_salina.1